ncbi:MAG: threonine synthase [Francisellaceae bacterium]|jgi:threonine synthase
MKYISTRDKNCSVSLSYAMKTGLAADGGLYIPEEFPVIDWQNISKDTAYANFAQMVLAPFFKGDVLESKIKTICDNAFDFNVPVKKLDENNFLLELFHGPTLSFKDFGARFLANSLSLVESDQVITIIVATSGDTGSAVAAAFHKQPNIRVVVMFPKGKISKRQEKQITCWGDNVLAVSVEGVFDDCQAIVKEAFTNSWWSDRTHLNTSNSINVGRLLPQITYYAYTSWQHYLEYGDKANYIVPTGNIGNVSAAFWAKKIGFPINEIVLSQNANNTIGAYLASGEYSPKNSIETLANAMDVGKPSNLERLFNLFPEFKDFKHHIKAITVSDEQITQTIKEVYQKFDEEICPHTATAFFARKQLDSNKKYILVSTAHPAKFESVIEPILDKKIPATKALQELLDRKQVKVEISADMDELCSAYENYFI